MAKSVVVVGSGVFGVTAALELEERGWETSLIDPGPPHPLAASTDISKMIRADYGTDLLYMQLMEGCFPRWRKWNTTWGREWFHEDGFLILAGGPMQPGDYEHTSYQALLGRDYPLQLLATEDVRRRFPAWRGPHDVEGYFNPIGGWAASGRVVGQLVESARDAGVQMVTGSAERLLIEGSRITGVQTDNGGLRADMTVVAAGAWTVDIVPGLADLIETTGHPILHFRPGDLERFQPPAFPPWAADIATTGWYGFPAIDGVVKVANHGPGLAIAATDERIVADDWESLFRGFLAEWIPALSTAPVVYERLCLYTDTRDGDFIIDRHPEIDGLVVSTGGSGHGFKFAPVLGRLTADAVEGAAFEERFRWRTPTTTRTEAARGAHRPSA